MFLGTFLACLKASVLVASASLSSMPADGELALALLQAGARINEARLPTKPNPEPPRLYVAEGCDGSTATLQHAIRILALHGIDGGDPDVNKEILYGPSNPYYHKNGPTHNNIWASLHQMNKDHRELNQTLVMKSILHRDMEVTTSQALRNMGTLAVYVTRSNMLDQLVCMIRDCFLNTDPKGTVHGTPVKSNGKASNLCFKRRTSKSQNEKAWLRVSETYADNHTRSFLGESLDKLKDNVDSGYLKLKKAGFNPTRIAYEDIIAFEAGGSENLKTSLKAWTQLLKGWGVAAKHSELETYLKKYAHTWSQQRMHGTIYNYNEVAAELKNLGKHKELWLRD